MSVHHLKTILIRVLTPLALLTLVGCASSPKQESVPGDPESEDNSKYTPIPHEPKPIGILLTDLDWTIREWNRLVMSADTDEERRRAGVLERNLEETARRRLDDLVLQLETGPPNNRIVAATALGFSKMEEAHSPLLAALEDPDPKVVGNALLGLAVLARPDTPLDRITMLVDSSDATIRTMAVYAARAITANLDVEMSEKLASATRLRLSDTDPFMRSQCALLLAQTGQTDALEDIGDLVYDPEQLVSSSAIKSVAAIGRDDPHSLALAAKILASALDRADRSQRTRLYSGLASLGRKDFGSDTERWVEWAHSLQ